LFLAFMPIRILWAQDLEPRSYANTPVGMNFLLVGYAYSDGDVAIDPSTPWEDGKAKLHAAVVVRSASRIRSIRCRDISSTVSGVV